MAVTAKEVIELAQKGWLPVNEEKSLYINETLFRIGIISFLDPSNYQVSKTEEDGPFAVNPERQVILLKDDKSSKKAKQFFDLPTNTTSLRNTSRRDECYVPVMVANAHGKADAGLYIHPRKVGQEDSKTNQTLFTAFHAENCLLGSQLSCRTNKGSVRHSIKHHVEFYEGEYIVGITASPGDNSYETMQFEELRLMATIMAKYSVKDQDGKPTAIVTHHLPWLDYILSGVLLWSQGHMTYPALHAFCEMMISKKIEHEEKLGSIYHSHGLTSRFITPFDNLLDLGNEITADSILKQLGIDEREEIREQEPNLAMVEGLWSILKSNPEKKALLNGDTSESHALKQLFDDLQRRKLEKRKSREQALINQCTHLLTKNSFDLEQKKWWEKIITTKHSSGKDIETLEELLENANALALAIAASHDSEHSNTCSFVSTQGKQIQVVYEKLFKEMQLELPPVICWTSIPLFLTNSQSTVGATFYFEYLGHALTISQLIGRHIVEGAMANMMACMNGQEGKSVQFYLDPKIDTQPLHQFVRSISVQTEDKPIYSELKALVFSQEKLKNQHKVILEDFMPTLPRHTPITPRSHLTAEHMKYALHQLDREGFLTQNEFGEANRQAVVSGFGNPYDIAVCLIEMNRIGLLNQANRDAVSKHPHPNALWNLLQRLSKTNWFTPAIRQDVFNDLISNASILSSNNMCMRLDMPSNQFTMERFIRIIAIADKHKGHLLTALKELITFFLDDKIEGTNWAIQLEPDERIRPALLDYFADKPPYNARTKQSHKKIEAAEDSDEPLELRFNP